MQKRLLARMHILLFLLFVSGTLLAQKRTITGKVVDSKDGSPLAGVTVQAKGDLKIATTTGNDGSFSIAVAENTRVLVFSIIGYGSQEQTIGSGPMTIGLTTATSGLDEVVVIGYGTTRKKDLTGAVAVVDEKQFQKGTITTPEQMIAGKIPGVSVISNSGQPGSGSTIRFRGGSSFSASNAPLIVLDGVPLNSDNVAGAGNPLSFINPNDIESFTVLKDASAAAIYGARAAGGVIIITTKKGRGGELKVNFRSNNSMSTLTKQVSVLSPAQFRAVVNANGTPAQVAEMGAANTNWQDQIYQTAFGTDNHISLSGGVKDLPYRLSIGYQSQNGILKTDNLQRTSATLNLSPVLFDNHLKINLNVTGAVENTRFANQSAIGGAISFDPTQPVYSKSPRFGGYWEWLDPSTNTGLKALVGRNPLGLLEQHYNTSTPKRSIGNIQLDYSLHFFPDLHVNVNAGYDVANGSGKTYVPDSAAESYVAGGVNSGQNNQYKTTSTNTIFETYLSYTKDLKSIRSHIDARAGYSYYNYLTTQYNYASYYANDSMVPNSTPATPTSKSEHTLLSYFGRLIYSFEDKYILTATIRRDGSSRFAPTNRYANFPSAAFAWRIKNESFLQNSNTVSELKLRLGWGVTGQQDGLGNYDYLAYYYLSNSNASYQFGNNFYQGWRPAGFAATRQWEQTTTSNIGIDYGFLDNRIFGSIDYYYKKTNLLLNNVAQPAGSNFSAYQTENVGDMTNQGVEFSINFQPVRSRNVTWDVGINYAHNKNNITNLTVVPDDPNYVGFYSGSIAGGIGGQFAEINAVGSPKETFYLYRQVYDTKGSPIEGVFIDKNNDGVINQNDLYKTKPADPTDFIGFTTSVIWGKWNFATVLRSSLGMYNYNNIASQTGTLNQFVHNVTLNNGSTSYLASHFVGNAQELLSDYYISNASFLRMDNISIGYNFGTISHTRAILRMTAGVQNVFVITNYKGVDPEIGAGVDVGVGNPGIDNNNYPRPRVYNLAINLDF
jgi:iron complex outermembrane receptor protein